jgi:hypothetical protein
MNNDRYKFPLELRSYVRMLIDLQQAMWRHDDEDMWLTPREKDFAVATILCLWEGITNPNAKEAHQIYEKYFKNPISSSDIHVYIGKLRDKKFLSYDKNDQQLSVAPFWDGVREGTRWILELQVKDKV